MLCHSGEALSRQLDKTLSLMSQFAYVHNDNILLGLAIARKPAVSILSVAGISLYLGIFVKISIQIESYDKEFNDRVINLYLCKIFTGYTRLDRSTLSVFMIIIILTILAAANFKIME